MANCATLFGHEFRELTSVPVLVTCFAPEAGKVEHPSPFTVLHMACSARCRAMCPGEHKPERRVLPHRERGGCERFLRMTLAAVTPVLLHKLTLMVVRVTVGAPVMREAIHACP